MRQYLIVVLFSLIALSLSAQTDSVSYEAAPIEIITKHKGNEVMIRWAYTNPNDWLTHRGLSFDLYRRTLGEEGNHELVKENIAVAFIIVNGRHPKKEHPMARLIKKMNLKVNISYCIMLVILTLRRP